MRIPVSDLNQAQKLHRYLTTPEVQLDLRIIRGFVHASHKETNVAGVEMTCDAKCWLIYRCIEGHVPLADILSLPIPNYNLLEEAPRLRWHTSITAAECYLAVICENDPRKLHELVKLMTTYEKDIQQHPPAICNFLRVMVLGAYQAWLVGNIDMVNGFIDQGCHLWKQAAQHFDFQAYGTRIYEMLNGDSFALQHLMILGTKTNWSNDFEYVITRDNPPHPYFDALHLLGEGHPRQIW